MKEEVKTLRAQVQQLLEENDELRKNKMEVEAQIEDLRRELKDLKESGKIHLTMLTS